MAGPLLIDLSHTSHTRARTGVQRTALALRRELGAHALPVCRDPYERAWRPLDRWELLNLAAATPGTGRKAHWPLAARLRGLPAPDGAPAPIPWTVATAGAPPWGFLEPEIFHPRWRAPSMRLFRPAADRASGDFPRRDRPQISGNVPARDGGPAFPAYLRELLSFDGIAANSADSRDTLVSYWRWLGAAKSAPGGRPALGIGSGGRACRSPFSPRGSRRIRGAVAASTRPGRFGRVCPSCFASEPLRAARTTSRFSRPANGCGNRAPDSSFG